MLNRRRLIVAAGVWTCLWCAGVRPTPAGADEPAAKSSAGQSQDKDNVAIRYAQAYLKAQEAQLKAFQETNRKLPNTIRPSVIQSAETSVQVARDRLALLRDGKDDKPGAVFLASAQAELKQADEALRKAKTANKEFANTVRAVEVERLEAVAALARVRLEMAQQLDAASPLALVQWELEQLREQVHELNTIVALLRDRN